MHPDVLTLQGAADLLGVSAQTVRRRILAGELPAGKVAAEWRLWRPALLELLTGQAQPVQIDKQAIGTRELGARVGLSDQAVRRNVRQGVIPGVRVGATWRIYWPTIVESLQHRQEPPLPGRPATS